MDKEKFLQKVRITHIFSDEAKNYQTKTANSFGLVGFNFAIIGLLIYNLIMKLEYSQILGIYFTYQAFRSVGFYKASRERIDLIILIAASLVAVSSFIIYVINTLGL